MSEIKDVAVKVYGSTHEGDPSKLPVGLHRYDGKLRLQINGYEEISVSIPESTELPAVDARERAEAAILAALRVLAGDPDPTLRTVTRERDDWRAANEVNIEIGQKLRGNLTAAMKVVEAVRELEVDDDGRWVGTLDVSMALREFDARKGGPDVDQR